MQKPFFSIIIPTYNRENTIERCIASVLGQSYINFEVLVVDNQSVDKTIAIASNIDDDRVKVVVNEKNFERCYSRNRGVDLAIGEYVLFLDSDDYFEKDHLLNWEKYLKTRSIKNEFYVCNKKILQNEKFVATSDLNFINDIQISILKNPIIPGQICIAKDQFKSIKFNSEYLIFEDTAMWLELLEFNTLEIANHNTFVYVLHGDNSVDFAKSNFGYRRYISLRNFMNDHPSIIRKIGLSLFKQELSSSLFLVAKYYMNQQDRSNAIKYVLLSILKHFTTFQIKHRLYVLYRLIINFPVLEYNYLNR